MLLHHVIADGMQVVDIVLQGGIHAIHFMSRELFEREKKHLNSSPLLLQADPVTHGDKYNHHLCIPPGYSEHTAGTENEHWFVLDKTDASSVRAAGDAYVSALVRPLHLPPILCLDADAVVLPDLDVTMGKCSAEIDPFQPS